MVLVMGYNNIIKKTKESNGWDTVRLFTCRMDMQMDH